MLQHRCLGAFLSRRTENLRSKVFKNIRLYLVCLIFAALFLAVYSTTTTPLLDGKWGSDSAFFILVGQGMTKGMLPYRDFFDMKGPYLFFLEFIGQLICPGRTGAFIIQCFSMSLSLYIIGKTSDLFSGRLIWLHRFIASLPVFIIAVVTFEGGNLTEEFCLPLILASLYFCLRYFKDAAETRNYKHNLLYSLYHGAAVGFICFLRITNAATIGAVLLTVFLFLLAKKQIKNALINLVMVLAGFAGTCAVPVAFFASKNMLNEMLDQVFVFGVAYSSELGFGDKLGLVFSTYRCFLLLLLVPVIASVIYREKWYIKLLSISSAVLLLVAVTMGNTLYHYCTLFIPHVILGIYIAYKKGGSIIKARKNIVYIFCFILIFASNVVWFARSGAKGFFTVYSYMISTSDTIANNGLTKRLKSIPGASDYIFTGEENEKALEIASRIPDNEKDSVYGFGDVYWSWWYAVTDTMPACKYMDWHLNYLGLIPGLDEEISDWISDEGCIWIVTPAEDEPLSVTVYDAIEENYEAVFSNEAYTLYRRVS